MESDGRAQDRDEIYTLTLTLGDAVRNCDLDQLGLVLSRRGTLIARLPRAEGRLRQIAELDRVTEAMLRRWMERVMEELAGVRRGAIALKGYHAQTDGAAFGLDEVS